MAFQERVQSQFQNGMSQFDKELSKYQPLVNFEKQTNVPKVYVIGGLGLLYFILIFFNLGGQLLVNLAGFGIPAYYSLQALFTTQTADDTQWLTYWVCFSFLSVLEAGFDPTYWVPFYYLFKFAAILWLALPQFSGAQILFRTALFPLFARYFQAPNRSANIRAKADAAEGKTL
ncbi:protein yop1 [Drechslerella stenobrocha 248]|uniref:Protein YOP1 n=1 Tax=Drechslerella stenobrocha 248 TaxID=1043628 RepID=W7HPL5_9PEZI|nr:protein yop1 [Drechslerella stenobrocha 248]